MPAGLAEGSWKGLAKYTGCWRRQQAVLGRRFLRNWRGAAGTTRPRLRPVAGGWGSLSRGYGLSRRGPGMFPTARQFRWRPEPRPRPHHSNVGLDPGRPHRHSGGDWNPPTPPSFPRRRESRGDVEAGAVRGLKAIRYAHSDNRKTLAAGRPSLLRAGCDGMLGPVRRRTCLLRFPAGPQQLSRCGGRQLRPWGLPWYSCSARPCPPASGNCRPRDKRAPPRKLWEQVWTG